MQIFTKQEKLINLLKSKKCFKLVCGAGNEDAIEVEKLVALYAKAGAKYFDLSPREDVVLAAKRAIERVIPQEDREDYFLNVSVGLSGDHHARKAFILKDKCAKCGLCSKQCLQCAITNIGDVYGVIEKRCIGCGACEKVCPTKAINFLHKEINFKEILPSLIELGLDSLELHASTDDDELAISQWKELSQIFDGVLSLCIDRSNLSDKKMINRIKEMLVGRLDYTTIIQADGAPMSGANDDINTTLQTVATADIVEKVNLPVFILLSGGTNSKTTTLAKYCEVDVNGVSLGSYARKIVKQYIEREDFLDNEEEFEKALLIAKDLVDKSISNL